MDPHLPFLKAIVADRHDDLPRLVYADFLEETGEPQHLARAHFIRTQINLESADPKSGLYADMKALEARILDYYLEDWQFELPEPLWYSDGVQQVIWGRGFVADLGPMWEHGFEEYGSVALGELPLTSVQLTGSGDSVRFEHHSNLNYISRLKLGPSLTALYSPPDEPTHMFESLVTAPVFTSLRHLDLSENGLTDAWVIRFAAAFPAASFAPTLETLDLSRNFGITDAGANVLATAAGFDGLKRLVVKDTGIGIAGLGMLRKRFGNRLASGPA